MSRLLVARLMGLLVVALVAVHVVAAWVVLRGADWRLQAAAGVLLAYLTVGVIGPVRECFAHQEEGR